MSGRPTIRAAASFDAESDAAGLKTAMKGFGTDEAAIIEILASRSAAQRKGIASKYLASFGKHLEKALKSELKGNFEDVIIASLRELPEMNAHFLRAAMKGGGTKECVLIQVLAPASNAEIIAVKEAYKHGDANEPDVERNLEKDIESEASGDFKSILIALLQGQRDESSHIDRQKAETDADDLYACGEGKRGTEESKFIQIMVSRSFGHIRKIAKIYSEKYDKTLVDAIKKETSGSFCDTLTSIVCFAEDPHMTYATWIQESMAGMGTSDSDLIRLILARAEIDLEDVKTAYQKRYNKLLPTAVQSETSGDYKKMLLAILQGNQ